jgi:hypothetical protein
MTLETNMTLETSQIGVRLAVGDPAGTPAGPAEPAAPAPRPTPSRMQAIVNACVQRVLATLKRLQAR